MNTKAFFDELDEVVYVRDPVSFDLLYINPLGRKLLGLSDTGAVQGKCYELIRGRNEPCAECPHRELVPDKFHIWEYYNFHLKRHFIAKNKLVEWDGRPAHLGWLIDATKKETVGTVKTAKSIRDCAQALFSIENMDDAIQSVLEEIGLHYQAERVNVYEINQDAHICKKIYEWQNTGTAPQDDSLQKISLHNLKNCLEIFGKNKPVIVTNSEDICFVSPEEYEVLRKRGIRSLLAIPLFVQKKLTGFIAVSNPSKWRNDIEFLSSLSYFITIGLEKQQMYAKLKFMRHYDSLSGLLNRQSYAEYVEQLEKEKPHSIGVLIADINGLKQINQHFGYQSGDNMIKHIAEVLRKYFDEQEVFRLNGDEFMVLCTNIDRESFVTKINAAEADFAKLKSNSVSLGYTWADNDINIQELSEHADELMLIEKQKYNINRQTASKHYRPMVARGLLEMIANQQFEMYLQPNADIKTGSITGAEALVRLNHPQDGVVLPNKFIPFLEKEKLIRHVDFFMFEETCKRLSEWKQAGCPLLPISLNFSRVTLLETDLINVLLSIHEQYDVPRELIEIEITESIGEMERETIADIGAKIKAHGFGIALDDFGAKYTNMSMLTVIKFNTLKIDRSLVNGLVYNKDNQTVVKHVIAMCREMGILSVAEGVETTEQLLLLKEFQCDVAQGYLFDRPIPVEQFAKRYMGNQCCTDLNQLNFYV